MTKKRQIESRLPAILILIDLVIILLLATAGCGGGSSPTDVSELQVSPTAVTLAAGTSQKITVTAVYSDNSNKDVTDNVEYVSENKIIADTDNTGTGPGVITGLSQGTTVITVRDTSSGAQTTSTVTVSGALASSLQLTPDKSSISIGATEQFIAVGIFSDNSTQDLTITSSFSSSNPDVASIDAAGLAKGLREGSAVITSIDSRTGLQGSSTLTVSGTSVIQPVVTDVSPRALNAGDQCTITGSGFGSADSQKASGAVTFGNIPAQTYISWTDTKIVVVVPSGTVTGALTITVTNSSGIASAASTASQVSVENNGNNSSTVPVSIDVTPSGKTIIKATTQQFTATGHFQDQTTQDITDKVTWTSSSEAVASVSNAAGKKGLATAVADGSAAIKASYPGSQISGSTSLSVKTAKLVSISLTPANPVLQIGKTQQFTATGHYEDNSTQDISNLVTWASSSTQCATVSNAQGSKGLATSVAAGTSTVTATIPGTASITGTTTLTVSGRKLVSIEVTPSQPSIAAGETVQFSATGHLDDSSTIDLTDKVTWQSDNTDVATVSALGLAKALKTGSAVITATESLSTIKNSATLDVTASVSGFSRQDSPSDSYSLRGASFRDPLNGWIVGLAGTILHTENGGDTWTVQNSSVTGDLYDVSFTDSSHGWIAGAAGIILHSTDSGSSWTSQQSGVNSSLRSLSFVSENKGWAAGDGGVIVHTDDGGDTWTGQNPGGSSQILNTIEFIDENTGWAAGEGGTVIHTSDGGATWTDQSAATVALYGVSCLNADTAWISGQNGTILHTIDGGATWNSQTTGTTAALYSISFGDALNGWAVADSGQILYTDDGGLHWHSYTYNNANCLYSVFFLTPDIGWIAGEGGTILHTSSGGK